VVSELSTAGASSAQLSPTKSGLMHAHNFSSGCPPAEVAGDAVGAHEKVLLANELGILQAHLRKSLAIARCTQVPLSEALTRAVSMARMLRTRSMWTCADGRQQVAEQACACVCISTRARAFGRHLYDYF